MTRISQLNIAP